MAPFLLLLLLQELPREVVEGLRSPEIVVREQAAARIRAQGPAALPGLEALAGDSDLDVRALASAIAAQIRNAAAFPPLLQKAFPGIALRLAGSGDAPWTDLFLEAVPDVFVPADGEPGVEPKHEGLGRRELEPLAARALKGAVEPRHAETVLLHVVIRELRVPAAVLAPFSRTGTPEFRTMVVRALTKTGGPEAVELLKDRLSDADPHVAGWAAVGIALLGDATLADRMERLILAHDCDGYCPMPATAAQALSRLGEGGRAGKLREMSRSPDVQFRSRAAEVLGWLGGEREIEVLERLSKDEDEIVSHTALRAMGQVGGARAVDRLRAALDGEEAANAAFGLIRLGDRRALPELLRLLGKEESPARVNAVWALAALGAVEALEPLARLAKSGTPDERYAASIARARLGARDEIPALQAWMKNGDHWQRGGAATELCLLGERSGAARVIETKDELSCLNALRRPAEWAALGKIRPPAESTVGTAAQILGALAKAADRSIDAGPAAWGELAACHIHSGLTRSASVVDLLGELEERLLGRVHFVLEEARIRVVTCEEGHRFWEAWAREGGK